MTQMLTPLYAPRQLIIGGAVYLISSWLFFHFANFFDVFFQVGIVIKYSFVKIFNYSI